jgi:hypothetical protein
MAIKNKYERLLARRVPQDDRAIRNFSESFESQLGEATKYLIGAMAPVASRYTERLVEQGDRIENQLKSRLSAEYPSLKFRRQGSVSNHTHIRYYSDVDVLVIIDKFEGVEPPMKPTNPYTGNANQDLLDLRARCAEELAKAFPAARVDDEGATCVTIEGGSLICPVDAVPSNWFNTNAWKQSGQEHDRGIQVYNRDKKARIKNHPFLFNHRIHSCDIAGLGVPRCYIRLLKNIKADHENADVNAEIDFSSFDICSLVYRMQTDAIQGKRNKPLNLIYELLIWMQTVLKDEPLRISLMSVDDSRKIFDSPAKLVGLRTIFEDLKILYRQALEEIQSRELITESHLP